MQCENCNNQNGEGLKEVNKHTKRAKLKKRPSDKNGD
jgi:hypothetical protein